MKQYKKIIYSLAIGSLMSMNSCTDLTETIYDQLTDDVVDLTDKDVIGAMMGESYAQLRFL